MLISHIKKIFCIFFSLFFLSNTTSAQDKNSNSDDKASYFKASIAYLSNSVYNGRKDSLTTPYITPSISYFNKSGFYANASLSYLPSSSQKRIDLFTLEAGYDFNITSALSSGFYADKYFYNQASTNIQSDIKGEAGGNLAYDFGFLQLSTSVDVLFDTKTDFSVTPGINHAFYIGSDNNQWTINPGITANISTLNFYEGYTNRRAGKNAAKPNGATATATTSITNRSTGLTLLAYECAIPISYDAQKWGFAFTPTLALPQNPIYTSTTTTVTTRAGLSTAATKNSTPISEKNLTSTFYAELSFYLKF